MLAKLEKKLPADEDRYGWEFKWDGARDDLRQQRQRAAGLP